MEQQVRQPRAGKAARTILEWIEELLIAAVTIAVICTFVCRIVTVTGTSMVPSFQDGDRVLVVHDWNGVEQGDVVVAVNVLDEPIIKRVIATEGQTVDLIMSRAVLVDGQPVDETQFGLENGITEEPYSSFELLEFPSDRAGRLRVCLRGQPGCLGGQPLSGRRNDRHPEYSGQGSFSSAPPKESGASEVIPPYFSRC